MSLASAASARARTSLRRGRSGRRIGPQGLTTPAPGLPEEVNDNISSLINNTSKTVQFCTDAGYKGTCVNFAPGYAFSQVPYNDTYSSMRFV